MTEPHDPERQLRRGRGDSGVWTHEFHGGSEVRSRLWRMNRSLSALHAEGKILEVRQVHSGIIFAVNL